MDNFLLMNKEDFASFYPVIEILDSDVLVTKRGEMYKIGVEISDEKVIQVCTSNSRDFNEKISKVLPHVEEIKTHINLWQDS